MAMATASSVETSSIWSAMLGLPERDNETRSDAIDLVRAGRAAGENGGFGGLYGDDSDLSVVSAQGFPGASKRGRGAHALDKAIDWPPV